MGFPQTAAVVNADDFFALAISAGLVGDTVEIPDTDVVLDLSPGWLAEAGIEPVLEQSWPVGQFNDWINLANSIRSADPDAVFVSTASVEEAVSMVDAFRTVGYNPDFLYMSQGAQSEFQEALGDAANGIAIHVSYHTSANFESLLAGEPYTNQDFIEDFSAIHGRAPDEDEAIPFAVCQGMEQAIRGTGGTDQAASGSGWLPAPRTTLFGPCSATSTGTRRASRSTGRTSSLSGRTESCRRSIPPSRGRST